MTQSLSLSSFARELRHWIEHPALPGTGSDQDFNRLALALFEVQFQHNAAYSQFCRRRGTMPGGVQHWREIPALPAVAFKELDVTSVPAGERTAVFFSSGTTGQHPSRHWHNEESRTLCEISAWAWFKPHLLPATDKLREWIVLSLTPPPAAVPHSSLVYMMDVIRRNSPCQRFDFVGHVCTGGEWEIEYERIVSTLHAAMTATRPVMLLGTAFSFVHLLDSFARDGVSFALPQGSRVMETGGYKGRSRTVPRSELHGALTSHLAIPDERIVCEYGMSELSSQAYDLSAEGAGGPKRIFRFPPWARACVVSPENGQEVALGETGLLRIVDLANVWSVLAVQTEDLAIRRDDGFELLGRVARAENRGCSLMTGDLR